MSRIMRGTLAGAGDAPATGETTTVLFDSGTVLVEQILSGRIEQPVAFAQPDDEWVAVIAGGADLDVGGKDVTLGPGEWIVIPAGTPHRLLRAEPGTSWLAVHARPT